MYLIPVYALSERNNSYYVSQANQQKAGTQIYSLTQCSRTVNECDWDILVVNDERINSHCLTRSWLERRKIYTGNIAISLNKKNLKGRHMPYKNDQNLMYCTVMYLQECKLKKRKRKHSSRVHTDRAVTRSDRITNKDEQ